MLIESEEFEKDRSVRSSYRNAVDALVGFGSTFDVRTLPISKKEENAVHQLLHFIECVEGKADIWPHEGDYQTYRIRAAFEVIVSKKPSKADLKSAVDTFIKIGSHKIGPSEEIEVENVHCPENFDELCRVLHDSLA